MKTYKATLLVGKKEIDYMIFDSENFRTAGKYTDERFDKAYPQYSNRTDVKIEIEIQK